MSCAGAAAGPGVPVAAPAYAFAAAAGERVPELELELVEPSGRKVPLRTASGKKGLVLITRDAECPVSQRYEPRVAALARDARFRGFRFAYLDSTPREPAAAAADARRLRPVTTYLDREGHAAGTLRAETTAVAFVIDAGGTLQYRGPVDDQYGISHQRTRADHAWLEDALLAVAKGQSPLLRRAAGVGCPLSTRAVALPNRVLTYHERVSRIIQDRCQVCHRVGGLAPMPLETFEQVYARRAVIKAMVEAGRMPPWSANPAHGEWANDRSLAPEQKRDLLAWIASGAPAGDPAQAPVPRTFDRRWKIGKPDAVVPIPEPLRVPASGTVEYKYVYTKTDFGRDRWVTAIEIRPTQPKVVHHVIVLLKEPGRKYLSAAERARIPPGQPLPPEPGDTATGFFGITVPGSLGLVFPPGTGKKLPRGAWLKFEIHYQPNGTEVVDRTEIGLKFSDKPLQEVESRSAANALFEIPPNDPRYAVVATHEFSSAGRLQSLFPHMHLRGTAFRYELRDAQGHSRVLLDVPRFDFNWQSYYEFREPVRVAKGDRLIATAVYDNSAANPWNPDPTRRVRWGWQTTDEMMIGYFDFIADKTQPR